SSQLPTVTLSPYTTLFRSFVGIMFTLVGFGFKLALVPFHFWAPDTYEGAPTPVTAFLSVVSKAAGIAVIVRFLINVAPAIAPAQDRKSTRLNSSHVKISYA